MNNPNRPPCMNNNGNRAVSPPFIRYNAYNNLRDPRLNPNPTPTETRNPGAVSYLPRNTNITIYNQQHPYFYGNTQINPYTYLPVNLNNSWNVVRQQGFSQTPVPFERNGNHAVSTLSYPINSVNWSHPHGVLLRNVSPSHFRGSSPMLSHLNINPNQSFGTSPLMYQGISRPICASSFQSTNISPQVPLLQPESFFHNNITETTTQEQNYSIKDSNKWNKQSSQIGKDLHLKNQPADFIREKRSSLKRESENVKLDESRSRSYGTQDLLRDGKKRRSKTPKARESKIDRGGRTSHGTQNDPEKTKHRSLSRDKKTGEGAAKRSSSSVEGEGKNGDKDTALNAKGTDGLENTVWTRSTSAELYYKRNEEEPGNNKATKKCIALCEKFKKETMDRNEKVKSLKPVYVAPNVEIRRHICKHNDDDDSSSSSDDSELDEDDVMVELEKKQNHPDRLDKDLWHNEPGELNDGPFCRCSERSRRKGIRHNFYIGERCIPKCDPFSNNANKLFHYRVTVSPHTNFVVNMPTMIRYDDHEFLFEGFSLFSHHPIRKLPTCRVIRFNIIYQVIYLEEKFPDSFVVGELDLFFKYFFHEILELLDFDVKPENGKDGCPLFHFMPRFVREIPDNGKEILSMSKVLEYLIESNKLLVDKNYLKKLHDLSWANWQSFVNDIKGMLVTNPGKKPSTIRLDQLDRDISAHPDNLYPDIVHFGMRPPQLSYVRDPQYHKLWKSYKKFRHLVANMSKPSSKDKSDLAAKEKEVREMRAESRFKRGITIAITCQGFYKTGIKCDMVQHALLLPVLVSHLRFHKSLNSLEDRVSYKFKKRFLLQMALTHSSYSFRESFGTNPDHVRNSLTNCGMRQPEFGDCEVHYWNTRKKGINALINIMSKFEGDAKTKTEITHNERLEYLGDAVVEFITSVHLYHVFDKLQEGSLTTFRCNIVKNQNLALLSKKLGLDDYMLFAHGADLCHDDEYSHALADCFEAFIGAIYLDGGIEAADKIFSRALFDPQKEKDELDAWENYPPDPLIVQEPEGDRKWIDSFPMLQNLKVFEQSVGLKFRHIRLLARAFTDRSVGYTNLTEGSYQRMEFLGDTVLQLVISTYLYKHYPSHHEGHLSLLRSSLVCNRMQATICDQLGMAPYMVHERSHPDLTVKDRADLLESFIAALYLDQGLDVVEVFCKVCFIPYLDDSIAEQGWNNPKSKLQQCCLTLRSIDGSEPDIPVYKVVGCNGPRSGHLYNVAVYFRDKRLAEAIGSTIHEAEVNAAEKALSQAKELFPHLEYQEKIINKSLKVHGKKKGAFASNLVKKKMKPVCNVKQELPLAYRNSANVEEGKEIIPKKILPKSEE